MIEIIRNYGGRNVLLNGHANNCSLNNSEIAILEILNAKLSLDLDTETQKSIEGLRVICKKLIKQKWSIYDLHELGISLRSLGVICLKLRGLYGYPHNPFGVFGINKNVFIEQSYG